MFVRNFVTWKLDCLIVRKMQLCSAVVIECRYTVSQNLSPEWSVPWCDTKELLVYDEEQLIRFCVFDQDQFSADDLIGCVKPVPVRKVMEQLRLNSGGQSLGGAAYATTLRQPSEEDVWSRWRLQMTFRLTSSFSGNCEVTNCLICWNFSVIRKYVSKHAYAR